MQNKVIVITGAARRIGRAIAQKLHQQGANIVVHYRHSSDDAGQLCEELNHARKDSAAAFGADLNDLDALESFSREVIAANPQIDALINNASSFYPTPVGTATTEQWDDLIGSNLRAPFFLSQQFAPQLTQAKGAIINLIDIHASRPLVAHPIYCSAKAGLQMLTQSLAKELGPHVRVNGIAPGPILWPENDIDEKAKAAIVESTLLQRHGDPDDIAKAALFFLQDAPFVTGQILAVDGGRSLR